MAREDFVGVMLPRTTAARLRALKDRLAREGLRSVPEGLLNGDELTNGLVVDAAISALERAMARKKGRR